MATADNVAEDEPDDSPWHVVDGARWGDEACAVEDDGEVNVLYRRVGPLKVNEVGDERASSADQEEEYKTAVKAVSAILNRDELTAY